MNQLSIVVTEVVWCITVLPCKCVSPLNFPAFTKVQSWTILALLACGSKSTSGSRSIKKMSSSCNETVLMWFFCPITGAGSGISSWCIILDCWCLELGPFAKETEEGTWWGAGCWLRFSFSCEGNCISYCIINDEGAGGIGVGKEVGGRSRLPEPDMLLQEYWELVVAMVASESDKTAGDGCSSILTPFCACSGVFFLAVFPLRNPAAFFAFLLANRRAWPK